MGESQVTVVCTSYNYGRYISRAIESFLNQKTSFEFDILIVDDCSTDDSVEILRSYQERFPDKIRLHLNQHNQGITKTWIEICDQVTAKYIARCDADDFWIDEYKLQKQYDLLESNPNSKWCNTDFNIVDENDVVIHEQVFQNGPIAYANTYEKMLATKGMTLPSSWMIETALMQEVNHIIDPESVDDGFPMQLEFFHVTDLTFVKDATVAYRMTSNSDSRPVSPEKMKYRIDGLLKTQLDYLDKFPHQNMQEIAKIQAHHDAKQELKIFELSNMVHDLKAHNHHLQSQLATSEKEKEDFAHRYHSVVHSRRWTIPTRIINFFSKGKK